MKLGAGVTIAGSDSVPDRTTDWTSTISKVNATNANVVIFTGYYPQAAQLFTQLRNTGYRGILAGGDGVLSPGILSLATSSVLEGVRLSSGTVAISDFSNNLESNFRSIIGRASGIYAAEAMDAANVLLTCIANGVKTRSQMLGCIDTFNGESVFGKQFSFDVNGDNASSPIYAHEIRSGSVRFMDTSLRSRQTIDEIIESFPWGQAAKLRAEEAAKRAVDAANRAADDANKAAADAQTKADAARIIEDARAQAAKILDKARAAAKKRTIICVKGKLTKKVTAVKPKCPTGYKKK
jgi:hypothetical protein